MLGRRGEAARKWIRFQPALHFPIAPWICSTLVEDRDANDADICGVVMFLGGIRFAHGAETKRRDCLGALAKACHCDLRARHDEISALKQRSLPRVDHIKSIDGQHYLEWQIAL